MAGCVWALVDENITEHMIMNQNLKVYQWIFFYDGVTGSQGVHNHDGYLVGDMDNKEKGHP
jgi:hypothetical protein